MTAPLGGSIGGMTPGLSGRGGGATASAGKTSPAFANLLAPQMTQRGMPTSAAAASTGTGPYVGPGSSRQFAGEPFAVWVGMLALLWLLGWFAGKPDTLGGANPAFIKVGGYNFLAVGVTAAVFIALLKVVANKTNFPGFVEFANAL